ncbi:MAG: hypothetical protein FWC50_11020 [Planctomycetaceae bacterium]|nr:hypothetical protein [Planctomycetaceae bacterium]
MSDDQIPHNPFSTRNISPGTIPYLFEWNQPNSDTKVLYDSFAKSNFLAQIVGPHGSGKSTLLAALLTTLQQNGHNTVFVSLHDRQRFLPGKFWKELPTENCRFFPYKKTGVKPPILVIDGYEQLCYLTRFFLQFAKKTTGCGLLITTHYAFCGVPVLHQTATSLETFKAIVRNLLHHFDTTPKIISSRFSDEFLESLFFEKHGNIREMLFALYDRYEENRS